MIEYGLKQTLEQKLNEKIRSVGLMGKGQIGGVYKICTDQNSYVLKTSDPSERLLTEAEMLEDINKYKIAVPQVIDAGESHLLMDFIKEGSLPKSTMEIEAAEVLSKLHAVTNESRMYGYYYNTTIGPFEQQNEQTQYNWGLFLGQMRIMPMARICYDKGAIGKEFVDGLERLCRDLYKRMDMSAVTPSLLHGDLWAGNILFNIKGATLIDPAIYFGDREMELAFILMFDTFGETFFEHYTEIHPLSKDFYETKVPLYQIYPILVHVALYGTVYVRQLEQVLKRLKA